MSGHSHAKTIKHQKEITDHKKGQVFSKMARVISIAVKEGGPSPEINSKLRMAIEMAKKFNMPKDNIERAIKKGTGELAGDVLEEVLFEAYGPGGIAIIVEGITDNKNRALGEVKQILNQNGGKMVGEGAVRWMFDRKGAIVIDCGAQIESLRNKEALEMSAIEAEAQDVCWRGEILDVYAKPEELEKVKKNLEGKGIKIESVSLDWVSRETMTLPEKEKSAAEKLFEALDGSDAVQEIYSNLES